jgi:hypothetical protein
MAEWIKFEAIKRSVPLLTVLAHYRITELRRSGKYRLRGRCPLHGGKGRETFHADTAAQIFSLLLVRCGRIGIGPSGGDRALWRAAGSGETVRMEGRMAAWGTSLAANSYEKNRVGSSVGISFAGSRSPASVPCFEGDRRNYRVRVRSRLLRRPWVDAASAGDPDSR